MSDTMFQTVWTDIVGRDLEVGDRIAYATSQSNSVEMKIGTITELVMSKKVADWQTPSPKIRVQVEQTSGYLPPEKPVLISKLDRVVKL